MALRISRSSRSCFELDFVDAEGVSHRDWATIQAVAGRLNARRPGVPLLAPAELHAVTVLDAAFRDVLRPWLAAHRPALQQSLASQTSWPEFSAGWSVEFGGDAAVEPLLTILHNANGAAGVVVDLVRLPTGLGQQTADIEAAVNALPGLQGAPVLSFLRQALVAPTLAEQVRWVLTHWSAFLDPSLVQELLRSQDYFAEAWRGTQHGGGASPSPFDVDYFAVGDSDAERFSPDRDWMPNCVIVAKNIYVWLHQLSRKYQQSIARLDQIPEAELAELARRGINGLWMIGLWERSQASQRIKQMCGNADAVASAYSLYDYRIADALGGDGAWEALKDRASAHGVRLAADMVPNHVGVVSEWVKHHPDWFVSLPHSPFPNYTFHSQDLSDEPWLSIHVEDHYFDRSDAAVVFKRYDHRTGDERYIYHGNDGTTMPWNDTAQLDYLNPEVREAVIQTILQVARRFPIIRFDAAMTLVKQHVQRLWYPEPGTGGAIPSRSAHGLTRAEFDRRMPREFWQEVVDRVAAEVPDTLLLAEAFWMLEGYFVRNLGMHRVYNSAFMNMLRDEKNAEYRALMRQTLDADPQILKRFVNFMNNPDEDTAADQFGTGDKYFGVCVLMATMPGLPMFGHGQLEGFREKYGMDFRKPLRDEDVDQPLLAHHERIIVPLLHRRWLFSEVDHFVLYDVTTEQGPNPNVFAYSNRSGNERALVVYNNGGSGVAGWVKNSPQQALFDALGLAEGSLVRFRDLVSGLEFLRWADDLRHQGMFVSLQGYEHAVYLDWREVDPSVFAGLCQTLAGRGVSNLDDEASQEAARPLHEALEAYVHSEGSWDTVLARFGEHGIDLAATWKDDEPDVTFEEDELVAMAVLRLLKVIDPKNARIWFDRFGFARRLAISSDDLWLARAGLSVDSLTPSSWLENVDVQQALGVNWFEGKRWYSAEAFQTFIEHFGPWLGAPLVEYRAVVDALANAADGSYDFDALCQAVSTAA